MSGASNIYGSGMLSLGMAFSNEQLVIDNDIIGMIKYANEGVTVTDETLACSTIQEVGIGNDFLSCEDTLSNVDKPSKSRVLDRNMRPDWDIAGQKDTGDLAHEVVVDIMQNHVPTPLSEYALKRFDEIIATAEARMAEEASNVVENVEDRIKPPADTSKADDKKMVYEVRVDANTQAELEARAAGLVEAFDVKGCKNLAHEAIDAGANLVDLIVRGFTVGINRVGKLYEEQKLFLPQMMAAATGMNMAIDIMMPHLDGSVGFSGLGRFVIATIEGDIHSIGKDICAIMLKVAGFDVVNLGRDVPLPDIIQACIDNSAIAVGTSALMTSTMIGQKTFEDLMIKNGLKGKCLTNVGGAPVSQQWADDIGADVYSENSTALVEKMLKAVQGV